MGPDLAHLDSFLCLQARGELSRLVLVWFCTSVSILHVPCLSIGKQSQSLRDIQCSPGINLPDRLLEDESVLTVRLPGVSSHT